MHRVDGMPAWCAWRHLWSSSTLKLATHRSHSSSAADAKREVPCTIVSASANSSASATVSSRRSSRNAPPPHRTCDGVMAVVPVRERESEEHITCSLIPSSHARRHVHVWQGGSVRQGGAFAHLDTRAWVSVHPACRAGSKTRAEAVGVCLLCGGSQVSSLQC